MPVNNVSIHSYTGLLLVALASYAASVEDGVYEVDTHGVFGKRVVLPVIRGQIYSLNNANDRWAGDIGYPQAGFLEGNHYRVVLSGKQKNIWGFGKNGDTEFNFGFQLEAGEVEQAKALLSLPVHARHHPGHRIDGAFSTTKEAYRPGEKITVTLVIRNLSDQPFRFQQGGHQRGPRDDQFCFAGEGPDGGLKIKTASNFGGLSVLTTIAPHGELSLSVDLGNWIDVEKMGYYSLMGSYLLPIHDDDTIQSMAIWEDFLTRPFAFEVESAPAK